MKKDTFGRELKLEQVIIAYSVKDGIVVRNKGEILDIDDECSPGVLVGFDGWRMGCWIYDGENIVIVPEATSTTTSALDPYERFDIMEFE